MMKRLAIIVLGLGLLAACSAGSGDTNDFSGAYVGVNGGAVHGHDQNP
jgi:hypothetical protein